MSHSIVFTILLFFVTTLASISFQVTKVDTSTSINGELFNNITHCTNSHHISPSNIHVLMMGSEKYLRDYQLQVLSFQEYCKLHGYSFYAQDPDVVLNKVGTIRSDGGRPHQAVVSSKPLFIHCKRLSFPYSDCKESILMYLFQITCESYFTSMGARPSGCSLWTQTQ